MSESDEKHVLARQIETMIETGRITYDDLKGIIGKIPVPKEPKYIPEIELWWKLYHEWIEVPEVKECLDKLRLRNITTTIQLAYTNKGSTHFDMSKRVWKTDDSYKSTCHGVASMCNIDDDKVGVCQECSAVVRFE